MEIEFFCHPDEADKWFEYWLRERLEWYKNLGIRSDNIRLRSHEDNELAHYAKACQDVEYKFPWGWSELEGIANRRDFDLKQHQEYSGKDLTYFDDEKKEHFLPYVIEPSAGADRATLAFLVDAYDEDEAPTESGKMEKRVVLRFHRKLAPIKVSVLPLSKKEELVKVADGIFQKLKRRWFCEYDDRGSIGKRYRRQDELGTPFCVTVDFLTLEDQAVTIRERDSMKQERVKIAELEDRLADRLK